MPEMPGEKKLQEQGLFDVMKGILKSKGVISEPEHESILSKHLGNEVRPIQKPLKFVSPLEKERVVSAIERTCIELDVPSKNREEIIRHVRDVLEGKIEWMAEIERPTSEERKGGKIGILLHRELSKIVPGLDNPIGELTIKHQLEKIGIDPEASIEDIKDKKDKISDHLKNFLPEHFPGVNKWEIRRVIEKLLKD